MHLIVLFKKYNFLNTTLVCHNISLREAYVMHISLVVPIHVHIVQNYEILVSHRQISIVVNCMYPPE